MAVDSYQFDFNTNFETAMMDCVTFRYTAVDTETSGLFIRDGRSHCMGVSVAGRNPLFDNVLRSHYFPVAHSRNNLSPENKKALYEWLLSHNESKPLIFHNSKFDRVSLATVDMDIGDTFYYDTMIMAHMINENWPSKRLDWLSKNVLGRTGKRKPPIWEAMFALHGWTPSFPPEVMAIYATGDAEETLYLVEHFLPEFKRQGFDG